MQTRLKLLHRALILNNRIPHETHGRNCRLCGRQNESHLHIAACAKARPIWKWAFDIISDLEKKQTSPTVTKIIFALTHEGKSLRPGSVTIINVVWKIIYWHMWRQQLDDVAFTTQAAICSIVERIYSRISAHEIKRRSLERRRKARGAGASKKTLLLLATDRIV